MTEIEALDVLVDEKNRALLLLFVEPDRFSTPARRHLASLLIAQGVRAVGVTPDRVDWAAVFVRRRMEGKSGPLIQELAKELDFIQRSRRLGYPLLELVRYHTISDLDLACRIAASASADTIRRECPSIADCLEAEYGLAALIRDRVNTWAVEKSRQYLEFLLGNEDLTNESCFPFTRLRIAVWLIRERLLQLGVAPRWHPEVDVGPDALNTLLAVDEQFIELRWLADNWPNHFAGNRRWVRLFRDGFSFDVAEKVVRRSLSLTRKVKGLALTARQQVACRRFVSPEVMCQLKAIERMVETEKRRHRALQAGSHNGQPYDPEIQRRLQVYRCGLLTRWSNRQMRELFFQMTGESMSRQAMNHYISHATMYRSKKKRGFSI